MRKLQRRANARKLQSLGRRCGGWLVSYAKLLRFKASKSPGAVGVGGLSVFLRMYEC